MYDSRLQQLKKQSLDFRFRLREHKERPKALEMLRNSLNLSRTFLVQIKNITDKDEIYTAKDLEDLGKVINDTTVRCISLKLLRNAAENMTLRLGCHRPGNVQGKKNYSRSGKSPGILVSVTLRKNGHSEEKSGRIERIYLLPLEDGRNSWGQCDLNDIFP